MELLSPAGGPDSLKAAIENGADAIYIGAQNYSARNLAQNFDDIGAAVRQAHASRVKLYLALNTLIRDRETSDWLATAEAAAKAEIDAFIVQDLGGAMLLKKEFPGVPLHASTQMSAHNAKNVQALVSLGFSRIILARELTLTEIQAIRQATGAELEIFVHGAMCVSYSGQCLMSSILGGRSANRGLCAQPCRLDYSFGGKRGRLLSPRDLCLIDHLEEIRDAGVASIKIEGRMKPAEYVGTVTRIYRKALDGGRVTQKDKDDLLRAYSRRGFTDRPFAQKKLFTAALPPSPRVFPSFADMNQPPAGKRRKQPPHVLAAQIFSQEQALAVLPEVDLLYLPVGASWAMDVIRQAHAQNKACFAAHPLIDPSCQPNPAVPQAFDGELLPTLTPSDAKRRVADYSFNVMNSQTLHALAQLGYERATVSPELNFAQIADLSTALPTEAIVYGRLTLMTTIHCPIRCDKKHCLADGNNGITDRMNKKFPVLKTGNPCMVSIFNSLPVYIADKWPQLSCDVARMVFTFEPPGVCARVACEYRSAMQGKLPRPPREFTRGHFMRGVK